MSNSNRIKINWESVIEKGTGLLSRPNIQWWQSRHYSWSHMQPVIQKLVKLGCDADFLRAYVLRLAEIAEEEDAAQSSYKLSKGDKPIIFNKSTEAIKKIQSISKGVTLLHGQWDHYKGMVSGDGSIYPGEDSIDRAFSNLEAELDEYLAFYGLDEKEKKSKGKPSEDKALRILSGMDRYIEIKTGQFQRQLLVELTEVLFPKLQLLRGDLTAKQDQLRSVIHHFRGRSGGNADADLKALMREYKRFRDKFRRGA